MKEKKTSADWYIAGTHWLTTMIAAVIGAMILILLATLTKNPLVITIVGLVSWPFLIWVGVVYSTKYLKKTYLIEDSKKIVILATIYFVVVSGGLRVYDFLQTGVMEDGGIRFIIGAIVFYFVSMKYLKDNMNELES